MDSNIGAYFKYICDISINYFDLLILLSLDELMHIIKCTNNLDYHINSLTDRTVYITVVIFNDLFIYSFVDKPRLLINQDFYVGFINAF